VGNGSRSTLVNKSPNERGGVTPQNIARVDFYFISMNFLVSVIGVCDLSYFFISYLYAWNLAISEALTPYSKTGFSRCVSQVKPH